MSGLTRGSARLRAARAAVAGTAGAAAVVFALVTVALAFTAVAMPRYDVAFRDRALDQRLALASPDDTSMVVTANESLGADAVPDEIFDPATNQIHDILAQRLPMAAAGADWYSVETYAQSAVDAPVKGVVAAQPYFTLAYRSGLAAHARLVAGAMPADPAPAAGAGAPGGRPAAGAVAGGDYQVAVTQSIATRLGLRVGAVVHTAGSLRPLTLKVVGILAPKDPAAAYWSESPQLSNPAFVPQSGSVGAHWDADVYLSSAALGAVFGGGPDSPPVPLSLRWVMPLTLGGIGADRIRPVVAHVNAVVGEGTIAQPEAAVTEAIPNLLSDAAVASSLPGFLNPWLAAQDSLVAVLSLLLAGTATVGAVTVLVAGRLLANRREAELALRRARGHAVRQLALRVAGGAAVLALPAVAIGAAAARLATPGPPSTLAWWLAAAVAAVAVIGPAAAVAVRHRAAAPVGARRAKSAGRYARLRRWTLEGALALFAIAGLVLLRQQGHPGQGAVIDAYPAAAPALVAVPLAMLAPYGSDAATRLARRAAGRRRGAAVFVGLAQAGRPRPGTATAVFGLVLALGVVSFGPMLRDAVARGKVAAGWAAVGADAVVDVSGSGGRFSADAQRRIVEPAHADVVAAEVTQAAFPVAMPTYRFAAAVVDPAAYAALLAGTPAPAPPPAFAARPGAGAPVPIVTSPRLASELGSAPVRLALPESAPLTVQVAGTMAASALVPGTGGAGAGAGSNASAYGSGGAAAASGAGGGRMDFVLVPAWAVHPTSAAAASAPDAPAPNLLALRGAPLDQAALRAAVKRLAPGARLTLRTGALGNLPGATLQPGAYVLLTLGAATAAGFSVLILLLSLSLDARGRELLLTRLRCLGLDGGRIRAMAVTESSPTLLAAVLGGVAAAALVAPVVGPQLDLPAFTGSPAAVPMRASAAQLALPAAGLLLIAAATLLAHTALSHRRGMSRALRTGDW